MRRENTTQRQRHAARPLLQWAFLVEYNAAVQEQDEEVRSNESQAKSSQANLFQAKPRQERGGAAEVWGKKGRGYFYMSDALDEAC